MPAAAELLRLLVNRKSDNVGGVCDKAGWRFVQTATFESPKTSAVEQFIILVSNYNSVTGYGGPVLFFHESRNV